jgi:hypothetical protein
MVGDRFDGDVVSAPNTMPMSGRLSSRSALHLSVCAKSFCARASDCATLLKWRVTIWQISHN